MNLRNLMHILLGAVFYFCVATVGYAQGQLSSAQAQKKTEYSLGSDERPVAIKVVPPADSMEKAAQQEEWRKEKAKEDWQLTTATVWLAIFTCLLMIFTAKMWKATVDLGKEAKETSERQAEEMQKSLYIAKQAADAMSDVADSTRNNARLMQEVMEKQMRAYVVADTGVATYQDANNNFAGNVNLLNTGNTPAKNVSYTIQAGVHDPQSLTEGKLSDVGQILKHDAVLSPRQTFVIRGLVSNRFSDAEAKEIMRGEQKRLYVWGTVTYNDIFGKEWETNFCHYYVFQIDVADNTKVIPLAFYNPLHNSAT